MTRRGRSERALATIVAIEAIAIGIALAGCIGQVSAHSIGHPAQAAGPVAGAADHHAVVRVEPVTDDRDLDGVGHAAYLTVVAVPAATDEAPPFVCEVMDMDTGTTDLTPAADRTNPAHRTSTLLATRP